MIRHTARVLLRIAVSSIAIVTIVTAVTAADLDTMVTSGPRRYHVLQSGAGGVPVPGNPLEQDLKMAMHKTLLLTLPHGRQVLAPQSRHYIQNDSPQLVIDAIRSVVNDARR